MLCAVTVTGKVTVTGTVTVTFIVTISWHRMMASSRAYPASGPKGTSAATTPWQRVQAKMVFELSNCPLQALKQLCLALHSATRPVTTGHCHVEAVEFCWLESKDTSHEEPLKRQVHTREACAADAAATGSLAWRWGVMEGVLWGSPDEACLCIEPTAEPGRITA